jgi:hypothetical protein
VSNLLMPANRRAINVFIEHPRRFAHIIRRLWVAYSLRVLQRVYPPCQVYLPWQVYPPWRVGASLRSSFMLIDFQQPISQFRIDQPTPAPGYSSLACPFYY